MVQNRDKRRDPTQLLPGAKSVVCVALNYYTDVPHSEDVHCGKISRYAWGDDYHHIVGSKLEHLLAFVTSSGSGISGKIYVDTGPVMEKALAQRAGIGWVGKHTNLITAEAGSWVFLGELLLDVELAYDQPATDQCGNCTLCLEACPTQAIVEPYVLNANLCISYLTIENRGIMPDELAGKFDRWIYGCDICQDVCPWNLNGARPTLEPGFLPRDCNRAPGLEEIASLSEAEFQKRYRGSAMKRAKLNGLRRNAEFILASKNAESKKNQSNNHDNQ